MGFIYVGRLDEIKGIKLLFQAWKLMGDDAPELKVCGTGPLEDWCKEYVDKNHLSTVTMFGFVPNSRAKELIANSEAIILPTQWYEGFPMIILEAFSVGTSVITSDMGNAGDVVQEGVTGYKFKADSAESLIDSLKKCMAFPINGGKIKKHYEQKYSEEANYATLKHIYGLVV
ncbi:glycosyltransferase [Frisingicoccus sp.]|uniref:glycosyltransferase n=1 Tax=Frisingicoccus sp. TaxID=1918627 RepID=UPI003AB12837